MTTESLVGVISVAVVLSGVLITVGRNMQKIKANSDGLVEVKEDVDNVYNALRDVGKDITSSIEEKHGRLRESINDMNTRLGRVEGKIDILNGRKG